MKSPRDPARGAVPVAVLFIGFCTLLAYANSFRAAFTLDSVVIIAQDLRLRALSAENLGRILRENYWHTYSLTALYRPLTTLSYLVNWSVLGGEADPTGYHWVNFFLHWINASLVLILAHRLTASLPSAFVAGMVFALHPVATEAVTNLVGRADELATMGVLVGYLCHLNASQSLGLRRVTWVAGVGASMFFAVFSKESGLALCALLPLHDAIFLWPRLGGSVAQRLGKAARHALRSYTALAPAVGLWAWKHFDLARATLRDSPVFVDNPIAHATQPEALLTAVKVIARYLGLLIFPHTLSSDYSYDAIPIYGDGAPAWENLQCWFGLAIVLLLLALAWRLRRQTPLISFGIFSFFALLLPTSNLILPIGSIMAERFLYAPLIGFSLVVAPVLVTMGDAVGTRLAWREGRRRVVGAFLAVVLAALGMRTFARNADWLDNHALWRSAVHAEPESWAVHRGLALEIWNRRKDEGGVDAAIARAEIGLAVLDARPLPLPLRNNLLFKDLAIFYTRKAEFLLRREERGEANRFFLKSIEMLLRAREVDSYANRDSRRVRLSRGLEPDEIGDVGDPDIYKLLAHDYLQLERWNDAADAARWARHIAPGMPDAHRLLGDANLGLNRPEDAIVNFIQSLIWQPEDLALWARVRSVYEQLGVAPVPIADTPAGPRVDTATPVGHAHYLRACVDLAKLLHDAKMYEAAAAFRSKVIQDLSLPPGALDAAMQRSDG